MNKKPFYFGQLFCLILTIILSCSAAKAALELELTQGNSRALPIAILPFATSNTTQNLANDLQNIISNDLKNSGRFRLLDTTSVPNQNFTKDNLDYVYWQQQKANNVVTATLKQIKNNRYQIAFQLYDIYGKNILLDQSYTVKAWQLRSLMHHISDLIYTKLIGRRGIFSTKIAYVLVQRTPNNTPKYTLEVADADGKNPHALLVSRQPIMSPAWSPDGKSIAYVSFEGNRAAIYAQKIATGKRQIISKFPGINGAPAWSPNGKKMALVLTRSGTPKIYILNLATKKLIGLTQGPAIDTEPSWSPDGKAIIFTSNRGGGPQIYQINLKSRKVQRLTYQGSYNARASFSADGKNLVMLHQDGNLFGIAVQDMETGRLTMLTRAGFDESPSIAPNGSMVVYATNNNGRGVLAEVAIDGSVKLLLPAGEGEVQEPAWSPFLD